MTEDEIKRLYYYNRQYLGFKDFQDEQKYHMDMRRRHNIAHHTWGIVMGLQLERKETFIGSGIFETFIKPGLAVDGYGREIIVFQEVKIDEEELAAQSLDSGRHTVSLTYRREKSLPPQEGYRVCISEEQYTRWKETYEVSFGDELSDEAKHLPYESMSDDPDEPKEWPVCLGTIVWNSNSKVITSAEYLDSQDDGKRRYAGVIGGTLILGPSGTEILRGDDPQTKNPDGTPNRGLLIQSAQTIEVNIDSNDQPADMFAITKGSSRTEIFRVQEDGNVGIGTTNPQFKLDVPTGWFRFGPGDDGGRIYAVYGPQYAPILKLSDYDDPPRIQFQQIGDLDANSEENPKFASWIGHAKGKSNDIAIMGGNTGIGTDNPQEKLEIAGSVRGNQAGALRIQTNTGWTDIGSQNSLYSHFKTDRTKYYFDKEIRVDTGNIGSYNENLSLRTSGETRITIKNSNGNVGIGTTNPTAELDVNGRILRKGQTFSKAGQATHNDTVTPDWGTSDDWNIFVSPRIMGKEEGASEGDNALLKIVCYAEPLLNKTGWKITAKYKYNFWSDREGVWSDQHSSLQNGTVNYILVPK